MLTELHGMVRLAHLAMALTTLALLTFAAVGGLGIPTTVEPTRASALRLIALGGLVVLLGGAVVGTGATAGCLGLPFCDDRSTPLNAALHTAHRVAGILLFLGLAAVALRLRDRRGTALAAGLVHASLLLLLAQLVIGVLVVRFSFPSELRVLHLALAALIWWALSGLSSMTVEGKRE